MKADQSNRDYSKILDGAEISLQRRNSASQIAIEQCTNGAIGITIETERLMIVPVSRSDAADYHQFLFSRPTVMEKFASGEVRDKAYVDGRIDTWVKRWESGDPFGGFAIRLKSGEFVGHVVLGHGDEPGRSEIAYLIREDMWHKGFGSEAARGIVQGLAPLLRAYGFSVEGKEFTLIDATARPDNPGSGKILANMGMNIVSTSEKFNAFREHFQGEVALPDSSKGWEIFVFEDRTITLERDQK